MVQGYYTLEEAAKVLGMKPDELKAMAQRNEIRSFQDRGTWRFRIPDIQELARERGVGSDTDFIMSHSPKPRSGDSKSPKPTPEIFAFADESGSDDIVDVGTELVMPGSKKGGSKKPASPSPKAGKHGSDSDVRLVHDESDEMAVGGPEIKLSPGSDSDVKLVRDDSDVKMAATPKAPRPAPPKSGPARKQDSPKPPIDSDSDVRIVGVSGPKSGPARKQDSPRMPAESDSDVKIVGTSSVELDLGATPPKTTSDSDIRLEAGRRDASGDSPMGLTEEIDLDAELKKHEAAQKAKAEAKMKRKSDAPRVDETSPFELSDAGPSPGVPARGQRTSDIELRPKPDSSDMELTAPPADSSDFELTIQGSSPLEGDSDFTLQTSDESDMTIDLGSLEGNELKGPSSGISLGNPKDAGISLEKGDSNESLDFELSLDSQATPKPAAAGKKKDDSDSEFELSLDLDDSSGNNPAAKPAGTDSEFELTLDDSTDLSASDSRNPQVKAGDKDIFETDFEVPALEDESGSQVAALETDLDSSDFDLALDSSDLAAEDESGSQVVALDEEEAVDDAAATVAAKRKPSAKKTEAADDEDIAEFGDLEVDEEEISVEEEEPAASGEVVERVVVQEKLMPAAPWGALPVIFMLPCVAVMVLVSLIGYEVIQSQAGYKPAGFLTKTIAELVGQKVK